MIDTHAPAWSTSMPLAAERVISGAPVGRMHMGDAKSNYAYGLWEVTPGHFRAVPSDRDEVVHILCGSGELVSSQGDVLALTPGVILVIPAGFDGEWRVVETIRKAFVLTQPD